jgi:hypothetical protein
MLAVRSMVFLGHSVVCRLHGEPVGRRRRPGGGAGGRPADASSVVPGDEQGRVALMQSYHHAIEGFGSAKAGSTHRFVACTRMLCGLRGPPRVPTEAMWQEAGCRVCPHDGSRRMRRQGGQPQPAPLASVRLGGGNLQE